MTAFKIAIIIVLAALMTGLAAEPEPLITEPTEEQIISRVNRPHQINAEYNLTYGWVARPKIGTNILVVKLYDSSKKQVQDIEITTVTSMPAMKCCPPDGEVLMALNRTGDYVLPVNFTMIGEWEIKLSFFKDDDYLGSAFVKHNLK